MSLLDQNYRLEPGQVFEGKYRILRELGRGGFGMVFLGYQEAMDRHVALKVLNPGVGAQAPSARERFLREVKIISKLRHPNTVTIHDYGENVDGVVYMVLEFVEGDTLKDLLRREGAQEPIRALMLARQVARSLSEAHRHGIVHRDLKPANIMVMDIEGESDVIKVLDFGVARLLGANEADLTSVGVPDGERALIGTPRYMSPEQVRGESLNAPSDIYSMGLILYEMLVGAPAVQGDTTMGLIGQQLSPEPLRLPALQTMHPDLQHLVRKATQKSITLRHASAEAFADEVEQVAMIMTGGSARLSGPIPVPALLRHSGSWDAVPNDPSGNWNQQTPNHVGQANTGALRQQNFSPDEFETAPRQRTLNPATGRLSAVSAPDHTVGELPSNTPQRTSVPIRPTGRIPAVEPRRQPNQAAAGSPVPLMGYQDDFIEQDDFLGVRSGDLPPPPMQENNPFALPEPVEEQPPTAQEELPRAAEQAALVDFSVNIVVIMVLATLAVASVFVTFLFTAAVVEQFFSGAFKLVTTTIIALGIPLLTILGEGSQRERFHVIKKPIDRVRRICIATALFGLAVILLIGLLMAGTVTSELRNNPNWFLRSSAAVASEPGAFANLNRQISFGLADVVESTTSTFGLYSAPKAREAKGGPTILAPAPTRPTRPTPTTIEESSATSPEESEQIAPTPERPRGPAPTRNRDTAPKDTPKDAPKGEYIRW
ncbi:MAG: protein kinase [Bradymonadaceae bacterium]|nr:protein kinase [Lujinxingiaceae bacterium]